MYLASGLGQSESFPPSTPFFGSELFEESGDGLEEAEGAPFFGSELFDEFVGADGVAFAISFAAIQTNFLFFLSHMNVLPATLVVAPGFVQAPPNFAAANAPEVSPRSKVIQREVIANSVFFGFKKLDIRERLTLPDKFARAPAALSTNQAINDQLATRLIHPHYDMKTPPDTSKFRNGSRFPHNPSVSSVLENLNQTTFCQP